MATKLTVGPSQGPNRRVELQQGTDWQAIFDVLLMEADVLGTLEKKLIRLSAEGRASYAVIKQQIELLVEMQLVDRLEFGSRGSMDLSSAYSYELTDLGERVGEVITKTLQVDRSCTALRCHLNEVVEVHMCMIYSVETP